MIDKVSMPYEKFISNIFGDNWRYLQEPDVHGAWGVAILKSILDGVEPKLVKIAAHLNVEKWRLHKAYRHLFLNGVFLGDKIEQDRSALEAGNFHAWGYYAGYASGHAGTVVVWRPNERQKTPR